jgi:hypothetical protein
VDPLLDESIELRKMLGSSLKTLRTRTDLPPPTSMPNEQCPMSNVQCPSQKVIHREGVWITSLGAYVNGSAVVG